MKQTVFTILILSVSILCQNAAAAASEVKIHKGFVKLSDGVERYVEYSKPKAGKPWVVFTNGLVYELERWSGMDAELRDAGYGVLHYYFRGQDWTLAREVETHKTPLFFKSGLQSADFGEELNELIEKSGIQSKVVVVGLSYGAHVAASFAENHPEKVAQLVFLAPLVIPLESYEPQGAWLDWNLAWVRTFWGPYFYEYAYRQIYGSYLGQRVAERVPPHLSEIPEMYKESLFHLVRAVRDFDLRDFKFAGLEKNSVFFMVAQEEKEQAFQDQLTAFSGVAAKAQGSLIWLPESSHAIPDSEPRLAAQYLRYFMAQDPRLEQGKRYKSTSRGLTTW
jgi:pimeloyl-ACP methyl ester carboxylesterase